MISNNDEIDLAEIGAQIQSIGRNCEFGGIQRQCLGIDPLSMLRWAGSRREMLTLAFRERFAGLADAMTGQAVSLGNPPVDQYWWLTDSKYDIIFHTSEIVSKTTLDEAVERVRGRLKRSAEMQLESIANAEKLFLFSDATLTVPSDALDFAEAFHSIGPAWLLIVIADTAKMGTAELVKKGLIAGYVSKLTAPGNANMYDFSTWPSMLRQAHTIWQSQL